MAVKQLRPRKDTTVVGKPGETLKSAAVNQTIWYFLDPRSRDCCVGRAEESLRGPPDWIHSRQESGYCLDDIYIRIKRKPSWLHIKHAEMAKYSDAAGKLKGNSRQFPFADICVPHERPSTLLEE